MAAVQPELPSAGALLISTLCVSTGSIRRTGKGSGQNTHPQSFSRCLSAMVRWHERIFSCTLDKLIFSGVISHNTNVRIQLDFGRFGGQKGDAGRGASSPGAAWRAVITKHSHRGRGHTVTYSPETFVSCVVPRMHWAHCLSVLSTS